MSYIRQPWEPNGRKGGATAVRRELVGLAAVVAAGCIVAAALTSFSGELSDDVELRVLTQRAGLVMNPDAKVQMLGVQVGRVADIEQLPNGQAALRLAIDKAKLDTIPANVLVDIASTTVFGAKYVQLRMPGDPSPRPVVAGQTLDSRQVTVEINTVFEQLTGVLGSIEPVKLNQSLGALSRALSGRGERIGQTFSDMNAALAEVDPVLPVLRHELSALPGVLDTYAGAAPDLLTTAANAARLSNTFVEQQHQLDSILVSLIGLGGIGHQFLSDNRAQLEGFVRLLVPTTSLLDQYNAALTCSLNGMLDLAGVSEAMPASAAGIPLSVNFVWGHERYRYPQDLPKVGASGGPRCEVLPVKYQTHPRYVVTDTGTNPFQNGNQGWVLNSDGLKNLLFGPQDGPPRNVGQIGQPG